MENIKKLKEIQEFLKKKNDYWWNKERPDLDLKYYVPTDVICEGLVEYERRLTQEEYIQELVNMDINKGQIIKDRYCLTYKNQYFEIDIYPFSNDLAILEVELNNELQEIEFPYYLDILKEVTEDPRYRNSNLAKTKVLKR